MSQSEISRKNSEFWDELCGTQLAKTLGVKDDSPSSLAVFDKWYFDFYPYLFDHIPFSGFTGKDVLEVGLGYGTVAQKLVESGANYCGLDIAAGPVGMAERRIQQTGLYGRALQGSILEPPFSPQSFDAIIAIGCLHHTGDLAGAIQRCYSLLRRGGRLILMVYYAYSYRRFRDYSSVSLRYMMRELRGYRGVVGNSLESERAAYDTNSQGGGAPHTDWISIRSLKALCSEFSSFTAKLENIDQEPPFSKTPRAQLLKTKWPSLMGLDLYATARK